MATDSKPHLLLRGTAEVEAYTYPKPVRGPALRLAPRDRARHGQTLLSELQVVRDQLPDLARDRATLGIRGDRGVYLEISSASDAELALKPLDRRDRSQAQRHIELVAVREVGNTTFATVFVPEGKLATLEKLVEKYTTEDTRQGRPKNQDFVESIESIRRAVVRSFWTDSEEVFPVDGQPIWWEVWLRQGDDFETILGEFREHAAAQGLRVDDAVLSFPDRTVCLAHGTTEQITSSVELLDCVAELRKAKEVATFFTRMGAAEQAGWVAALSVVPPPVDAPAVCLLDSGITSAHPLLKPALTSQDLHSYDAKWGVGDSGRWGGHGTGMGGLSLYGDLTGVLPLSGQYPLEHRLESVKILPPDGFPENDRRLYGVITQEGAALPELVAPTRRRAYVHLANA